jgi:hypothetical protein
MLTQEQLEKLRARGFSDQQIQAEATRRGMSLPQENISGSRTQTQNPQQNTGFSIKETIKNVPRSFGQLVGGTAEALLHPVNTARTVGQIGLGGVQKLIPGQQESEVAFDQLTGFLKDRYGSPQNTLKTIQEDPVGFLGDLSGILTGGGAILRGAGTAGKISSLTRAGQATSQVGALIDPLTAPFRAVSGAKGVIKDAREVSAIKQKPKPGELDLRQQEPGSIFETKGVSAADLAEEANIPVSSVVPENMSQALPEFTKYLQKESLKMTMKESVAAKKQMEGVINTIVKEKINGSPAERVRRVNEIVDSAEATLDNFFKQSKVKFNRDEIARKLELIKGVYQYHRDALAIGDQVDEIIKTLKNMPDEIPAEKLNQFKRTTYQNAYNKAGQKVVDEIEHAAGDVIRNHMLEELSDMTISSKAGSVDLGTFSRAYGDLLAARKFLKIAEMRPEISGVTSRLVGALIGSMAFGGAPGIIGGSLLSGQIQSIVPATTFMTRYSLPLGRAVEVVGKAAKTTGSAVKKSEPGILGAQRLTESQEGREPKKLIDMLREIFGAQASKTDQDFTGSF